MHRSFSHLIAPSSVWCRRRRPHSHRVTGHSSTKCSIDWVAAPQIHPGSSASPHLWRFDLHRPTPHRPCFSSDQAPRARSNPGGTTVGSVTRSWFFTFELAYAFRRPWSPVESTIGGFSHMGLREDRRGGGRRNISSCTGSRSSATICSIDFAVTSSRRMYGGATLLMVCALDPHDEPVL